MAYSMGKKRTSYSIRSPYRKRVVIFVRTSPVCVTCYEDCYVRNVFLKIGSDKIDNLIALRSDFGFVGIKKYTLWEDNTQNGNIYAKYLKVLFLD